MSLDKRVSEDPEITMEELSKMTTPSPALGGQSVRDTFKSSMQFEMSGALGPIVMQMISEAYPHVKIKGASFRRGIMTVRTGLGNFSGFGADEILARVGAVVMAQRELVYKGLPWWRKALVWARGMFK